MHRILSMRANRDFSVDLQFEDGREARVDLSAILASAAIAAPFREADRFTSSAILIEDGEILHWDEQFELHADSLRYRAFPEELQGDYGNQPGGHGRPAA
jgi:hypothetical protein